jgi:hypothetical protein
MSEVGKHRSLRAPVSAALAALLAACSGEDTGPNAEPAAVSCLEDIAGYAEGGPFEYEMQSVGAVKFWVPNVPPGCKVPVVHFANGTTARCTSYGAALERLASHGFLAACYEDPRTGAGAYGLTAFDTAFEMFPDLADKKLGSTGHSQGGQAALVTVQLAEDKYGDAMKYAGLAMQPSSGYGTQPSGQTWQEAYAKIKSPVFMFSGDSARGFVNATLGGMDVGDGLVAVRWVDEGFDALGENVEAYHWIAVGATHIPPPIEPEQEISVAWFRWKLLGDQAACEYFKNMPSGGKWTVRAEQNTTSCEL